MSAPQDMVERAAVAIYREFIAHAVGTLWQKRGHDGRRLYTPDGRPVVESHEEATLRRWQAAPERTRAQFRREAAAALEAA